MRIFKLLVITSVAASALAAPLHAQHAGHAAPAAPAAKSDTSIARSAKDPHGGHGAHAAAGASNEHMSGWKELDAYHMVMMRVWHPAKEKGDLAPIRAHAAQLAARADTLQKGAIPSACDTPVNRQHVTAVHHESYALAGLVANGSDAAVLDALRALHDRFEVVNRRCKAG